jgi:hypothetical protein
MREPMRYALARHRAGRCALSMRMNPDRLGSLTRCTHACTVVMGQAFPDSFAYWFMSLTRDPEARDPVESKKVWQAHIYVEPHASASPRRPREGSRTRARPQASATCGTCALRLTPPRSSTCDWLLERRPTHALSSVSFRRRLRRLHAVGAVRCNAATLLCALTVATKCCSARTTRASASPRPRTPEAARPRHRRKACLSSRAAVCAT